MRNQQQSHAASHAQRLPPLFAVLDAVLPCDLQGVIEHQPGGLKADAVFAPVALVFDIIPGNQS